MTQSSRSARSRSATRSPTRPPETPPFWDVTTGKFTNAIDLKPSDELRKPDGTTVKVVALHVPQQDLTAYNFTVDDVHTYYVVAGDTPVLVHNTQGCGPGDINWNPKSVKTWGHTFNEHGAGAKILKSLKDRARSKGDAQGQWLDNDAAAEFLSNLYVPDSGPFGVKLPEGLGRVIMPDGSIVDAPYAYIVPNANGVIRTAYPTIGEP